MANSGPYNNIMTHIMGMIWNDKDANMELLWCNFLLIFKLWEMHGKASLHYLQYGKTMGRSCPQVLNSSHILLDLFVIWKLYGTLMTLNITYIFHTSSCKCKYEIHMSQLMQPIVPIFCLMISLYGNYMEYNIYTHNICVNLDRDVVMF